ncbi:hypothetical protein N0V91_000382 [Didymella pomorum]|uniref:Prokaryotic-type class I peptide chain release factors domain-containing protein n=1 Tax=Didymella pomorum TaxID=749634 RepID=A0A9W8ZNQ6_9PLEO|nr:hypothetical protein N0V91_000382 [Didymella pomorum]
MTTDMQLFRCRPALATATAARTPQAVQLRRTSARSGNGSSVDEEELQKARAWLAALHAEVIPLKTISELSFSRSSGPGGQNVNNRSRYVAAKSNDIIVQADDSRKQNDNALACYKRLYDAIVEAGRNAVPNETSAEQQRHVKNLQKADNERRLKIKKQQSAKKSSRRGRGDD